MQYTKMVNGANIKKAYYYLKKNGIKKTSYAVCERIFQKNRSQYCYAPISEKERIRQENTAWGNPIYFSVVVPMYETDQRFAKEMIESVLGQTYPFFELILADASKTEQVSCVVRSFSDKRIKYFRLEENKGISENSNEAIARAGGDYIALLDHDDLLTPDALYENAKLILDRKAAGLETAYVYSDEDKLAEDSKTYYDPNVKTEFNFDLLLSNNYICHLLVMKTELMKKLGFRKEFDGAQDFDLILRATAETLDADKSGEQTICHISKVLYHWRCHRLSTAANPQSKLYAYDAGKRAVEDYLAKHGIKGQVSHTSHNGFYRVEYGDKNNPWKDLFRQRKDIGALAGPIYEKNKITGGIYNKDGRCLYEGLRKGYSGYLHRASLHQDAEMIDIRNVVVNPDILETVINTIENKQLKEDLITKNLLENLRNSKITLSEREMFEANCLLSNTIRDLGYKLYYDPEFTQEAGKGVLL